MKRKDIIGIVICLVLTGIIVMLVGCDVYLTPDIKVALDQRIDQLQTDVETQSGDCKAMLQQDLDFLTDLQEAAQ